MLVNREPTRLTPDGRVEDYQTFAIRSPRDVLVRTACELVGCEQWQYGWETILDESCEPGRSLAATVRASGRTYREQRAEGGLTVFRFEPRQRCFADHRTRPERYIVRDGDWRGNPTGRRREHVRPADWIEDFGENRQQLAEQIERG